MKLSSTAILLIAAIAAVFPAASAAPVAVQGIIPDEESFLDFTFSNCDTKEDCPTYGKNSCQRIDDECHGQCKWDSSSSSCVYPSPNCSDFNNKKKCEKNDCDWVNNQCRIKCGIKEDCPQYDQNFCIKINEECDGQCEWDSSSSSCVHPSENCRDFNNKSQCERNDCDWVNNQCRIHIPFRCSDYDGDENECENKGCSWNDRYRTCDLVCRDFDKTSSSTCERSGYCTWSNKRCYMKSCRYLDGTSRKDCEEIAGLCTWNSSSGTCTSSSNGICRDFNNDREQCKKAENCNWVDDRCQINNENFLRCSDYDRTSRSKCEDKGCSWNSNYSTCRLVCRDFDNTSSSTCERSGYCSWNNSSRNCDLSEPCRYYDSTSRSECGDANPNCVWNDSTRTCRLEKVEVEVEEE